MSIKLLVAPLLVSGLMLASCSHKEETTEHKTPTPPAEATKDAAKKAETPPPAPAPEHK